jgi:hypothetical protein
MKRMAFTVKMRAMMAMLGRCLVLQSQDIFYLKLQGSGDEKNDIDRKGEGNDGDEGQVFSTAVPGYFTLNCTALVMQGGP